MTKRTATYAVAAAILMAGLLLISSCRSQSPESLGPSVPSGATEIPGGPMEQTPTPSSPKIPGSQQEAQDTVNRYLQETIDALPKGSSLDGTRYAIGDGATYCDDNPSGTDAPVHVEDWRDIALPPGTDYSALINQTGEVWKQWGWQVIERDGFSKPNRFGYAPDGYVLQIESRPDPTQAPSLIASSPCFPGNLRSNDVQRIPVISQKSS